MKKKSDDGVRGSRGIFRRETFSGWRVKSVRRRERSQIWDAREDISTNIEDIKQKELACFHVWLSVRMMI